MLGNHDDADLSGTRWGLDTIGGVRAVPGSDAILLFEAGGRLTGTTGCNAFSGTWEMDGAGISLVVGPMTLALCGDDALQAQESAYLAALGAAERHGVTGTILELLDGSGAVLAAFGELSTDLTGSTWEAISINNGRQAVVSLVPGTEVTAHFAADATLAGNGGCNSYTAAWRSEGPTIEIRGLSATERSCGPDTDDQENAYFDALANSTASFVTRRRLELRDSNGALQVLFRRADGLP